jgi:sec-independent protein translocase protein TatC
MASPSEDELAGTEQPFVAHLVELRDRLLRCVWGVAIVGVALAVWPGPRRLWDFLAQPLITALPSGAHMIAVGVVSPFLIPIKVTVLLAFGISLPWVLYQVWAFVAPGLYKHEKRLVMPLVVTSTLLFYAGVAFCYFIVFKKAFPAIQHMAPTSVTVSPDIEAYLDFVLTMFLAFGVAFEVPVAVVIVARLGIVSVDQLRAFRNYYWVCAAGVAGLVTPPDPGSMVALLLPMILLYEVGILVVPLFIRSTQAPDSSSEST